MLKIMPIERDYLRYYPSQPLRNLTAYCSIRFFENQGLIHRDFHTLKRRPRSKCGSAVFISNSIFTLSACKLITEPEGIISAEGVLSVPKRTLPIAAEGIVTVRVILGLRIVIRSDYRPFILYQLTGNFKGFNRSV